MCCLRKRRYLTDYIGEYHLCKSKTELELRMIWDKECLFSVFTWKVPFVRNNYINFMIFVSISMSLIFYKRLSCHIRSNAFSTTRKTNMVGQLLVVEWPEWKADCSRLIWCFRKFLNDERMTFYGIFNNDDKSAIGQ